MVASIQAQFPQSRIFGKFMVEVADKPVFGNSDYSPEKP